MNERDKAIQKLLAAVSKGSLAAVITDKSTEKPFNYSLLLAYLSISSTLADPKQNWFTAFAMLCIYQRLLAGEIIQLSRTADGKPELSLKAKKELIDAVGSGAKLTKADAG